MSEEEIRQRNDPILCMTCVCVCVCVCLCFTRKLEEKSFSYVSFRSAPFYILLLLLLLLLLLYVSTGVYNNNNNNKTVKNVPIYNGP